MGNSTSTPLVNYYINLDVFCLTFAAKDRVRLIMAPDEIIRLTGDLIISSWVIQRTIRSPGLVEFKLKGNPMETMGSSETYNFKCLISKILSSYYEIGWKIDATLSLNQMSTSQIIFKKCNPIYAQIACLCLDGNDIIAVLGPDDMVLTTRETLNTTWRKGILQENDFSLSSKQCFLFRLNGFPWNSTNEDHLEGSYLVCELFKNFEKIGWSYLASVGFSKKSTLFFKYSPDDKLQNMEIFPLIIGREDRLSFVNSPLKIIDLIRESIKVSWPHGIENEFDMPNIYEFKLKENPWISVGEDWISSRRIINKIIECLKINYYEMYAVSDLWSNSKKLSTIFFKKSSNASSQMCKTLIFSFNELNKLRITDDLNRFSSIIKEVCQIGWQRGVKLEKSIHGSHEFELIGCPFKNDPFSVDSIEFIIFMLILFDNLDKYINFKYINSVDLYDSFDSNLNALVFQTS